MSSPNTFLSLDRVNVGCGRTPTPGWLNFDNSLSVRIANAPAPLRQAIHTLRLLKPDQQRFVQAANELRLRWADARHLPLPDQSMRALYTSHMLEHLNRDGAARFLREAKRVLRPGGILRVAVPDLGILVEAYRADRDADAFVARTHMAVPPVDGLVDRLRFLFVGFREHAWMYDSVSLIKLITAAGFEHAAQMPPGQTRIPDPGELDLHERAHETVYVEASSP